MKFKLNVPERLTLLNLLPPENNFVTLGIIREVISHLSLNDKESVKYSLTQKGENVSFDAKLGMVEVDVEIGERAYGIICEKLEELNQNKTLTQQHFTLYKKFIEDKK